MFDVPARCAIGDDPATEPPQVVHVPSNRLRLSDSLPNSRNAVDSEFFIRKAIGWALGKYARAGAEAVRRFVEAHPDLSPL